MSSEEERIITPPEPASPESWTLENAPQAPEHVEDVLSEKLSEAAQRVTSQLDDLLPELTPAEPAAEAPQPPMFEPAAFEAPPAPEPIVLPPAPEPIVPPVTPPAEPPIAPTESSSDDRLISALAWVSMALLQLPLVSLIQLLSASSKDRPFQRHHAVTSLLFYAGGLAYEVVAGIAYLILGLVTLGIGFACLWVIFFVPHLLALYYGLQAYNGKRVELPILSDFARKQGWL